MTVRDSELYLIYVHKIGRSHSGKFYYEFIFSKDKDLINYEDWGWMEVPARGNSKPPETGFFDKVVQLVFGRFDINVLAEMNHFKYFDGYDNVIAIAWESEEDNSELDDGLKRLVFHYGDTLEDVKNKFYERDIIFDA